MRHALIAAALIAAPAVTMADGLSYTYVDGRYFSTDSDAVSINQHGGSLSGSLAIGPTFFVAADGSYGMSEKFTIGTQSGKVDTMAASLRAGVHHALTPVLDAVVSAGGLFADVSGSGDFKGTSDNDFGYIAEAGLRLALTPSVELGAFYTYQSIFNDDSGAFTADLMYHFNAQWSLVGSASNGANSDVYAVGARLNF